MFCEKLVVYQVDDKLSNGDGQTRVEKGLCPFPSEGILCPDCGSTELNLAVDEYSKTVGHCDICGFHRRLSNKELKRR